jgi:hypothetical protein
VAAGQFDAGRHGLKNLRVAEISRDMREAFDFIRARNASVRFIVTVSPVPLVATAENRSVLTSTTYSKSALRVVCEELAAEHADVAYFPAYEVITGNYARGRYFANDLRSVTEEGVGHVMRLFMKHYTSAAADTDQGRPAMRSDPGSEVRDQLAAMQKAAQVICDEEVLAR